VTHGHSDHNGNSAYLRERFDSKIAMHGGDLAMAESGDMFVGMKGLAVAIIRIMLPLVGMSRYDNFRPDIVLEDGRDLSEYGCARAQLVFHYGYNVQTCILDYRLEHRRGTGMALTERHARPTF
jgi:glyoxylase-like metal-dependent hydrolase (beta-lactamase superfamily II)